MKDLCNSVICIISNSDSTISGSLPKYENIIFISGNRENNLENIIIDGQSITREKTRFVRCEKHDL